MCVYMHVCMYVYVCVCARMEVTSAPGYFGNGESKVSGVSRAILGIG